MKNSDYWFLPIDLMYWGLGIGDWGLGIGDWGLGIGVLDQGQFSAAMPGLREVYRQNGDPNAADLLASAEERSGNNSEAIRLLEMVVDQWSPTPHFLLRLGNTYAANRQMGPAVAAWTRATHLGQGGYAKEPFHRLAEYYDRTGNVEAARHNHAQAYFAAGHEAYWELQLPEAKRAFEGALKYSPDYAPTWYYLGELPPTPGRNRPGAESLRALPED